MTDGQHALLIMLGALFALGLAVFTHRFLRSLRTGFSIRMQLFITLTGASVAVGLAFVVLELSPMDLANVGRSSLSLRLGVTVLLLASAVAAVAIVIGELVARPLERLTRTAQRVAAGERHAALPVPRGREVRALTRSLEVMRAELEQRHMLETFVADLSHELKNPIASIRASTEVLFDALERDPHSARRFVTRIDEAAQKLDHLTADLLTLARVEAHGQVSSAARVDLRELLDHALQVLHPLAHARSIELVVLGLDQAVVRGEATALRRALENLLHNACAFAPERSTIEIELAREGRELAVLVTDQGPGVDPALAPKVFERFTTTRQDQGGTGLGLAIVRAIAESHGGRAELRPRTTKGGATFALVLPAG